jgi:hypothetical protein
MLLLLDSIGLYLQKDMYAPGTLISMPYQDSTVIDRFKCCGPGWGLLGKL